MPQKFSISELSKQFPFLGIDCLMPCLLTFYGKVSFDTAILNQNESIVMFHKVTFVCSKLAEVDILKATISRLCKSKIENRYNFPAAIWNSAPSVAHISLRFDVLNFYP